MKKILVLVLCLLIITVIVLFFSMREKKETSQKINIGVFCDSSDENDEGLKSIKNSLQILEDDTNKKGGILGKKVNFIYVYGKNNMTKESKTVDKLKKKMKLTSILAYAKEKDIESLGKEATRLKLPMLVISSASPDVTKKCGIYVFNLSADNDFQGENLGKTAYNDLKAKKCAIIYNKKNEDSKKISESFKKSFEASGGQITAVETIETEKSDYKDTVEKIKASSPDLIFFPDNDISSVILARQLKVKGVNSIFFGRDVFGYSEALKVAREAINNSYFSTQSWSEEFESKNQEFLKEYEEKYKNTPENQGIISYEAAKALFAAMVNAEDSEGAKVQKSLEKMELNIDSEKVKFNSDRVINRPLYIIMIKDDKKVLFKKIG